MLGSSILLNLNTSAARSRRVNALQTVGTDVAYLGSLSKAFVPVHRKSQPNTLQPNTLIICTRVHPGQIRADYKEVTESTLVGLIIVP